MKSIANQFKRVSLLTIIIAIVFCAFFGLSKAYAGDTSYLNDVQFSDYIYLQIYNKAEEWDTEVIGQNGTPVRVWYNEDDGYWYSQNDKKERYYGSRYFFQNPSLIGLSDVSFNSYLITSDRQKIVGLDRAKANSPYLKKTIEGTFSYIGGSVVNAFGARLYKIDQSSESILDGYTLNLEYVGNNKFYISLKKQFTNDYSDNNGIPKDNIVYLSANHLKSNDHYYISFELDKEDAIIWEPERTQANGFFSLGTNVFGSKKYLCIEPGGKGVTLVDYKCDSLMLLEKNAAYIAEIQYSDGKGNYKTIYNYYDELYRYDYSPFFSISDIYSYTFSCSEPKSLFTYNSAYQAYKELKGGSLSEKISSLSSDPVASRKYVIQLGKYDKDYTKRTKGDVEGWSTLLENTDKTAIKLYAWKDYKVTYTINGLYNDTVQDEVTVFTGSPVSESLYQGCFGFSSGNKLTEGNWIAFQLPDKKNTGRTYYTKRVVITSGSDVLFDSAQNNSVLDDSWGVVSMCDIIQPNDATAVTADYQTGCVLINEMPSCDINVEITLDYRKGSLNKEYAFSYIESDGYLFDTMNVSSKNQTFTAYLSEQYKTPENVKDKKKQYVYSSLADTIDIHDTLSFTYSYQWHAVYDGVDHVIKGATSPVSQITLDTMVGEKKEVKIFCVITKTSKADKSQFITYISDEASAQDNHATVNLVGAYVKMKLVGVDSNNRTSDSVYLTIDLEGLSENERQYAINNIYSRMTSMDVYCDGKKLTTKTNKIGVESNTYDELTYQNRAYFVLSMGTHYIYGYEYTITKNGNYRFVINTDIIQIGGAEEFFADYSIELSYISNNIVDDVVVFGVELDSTNPDDVYIGCDNYAFSYIGDCYVYYAPIGEGKDSWTKISWENLRNSGDSNEPEIYNKLDENDKFLYFFKYTVNKPGIYSYKLIDNHGKAIFCGMYLYESIGASLDNLAIDVEESNTYNGLDQKPNIVIKNEENTLQEGAHYNVTYEYYNGSSYDPVTEVKNAGKYLVKITLLSPYNGVIKKEYTINQKTIGLSWEKLYYTYTGFLQELPKVKATGLEGYDTENDCELYAVRQNGETNIVDIGTYKIYAEIESSNGNYKLPSDNAVSVTMTESVGKVNNLEKVDVNKYINNPSAKSVAEALNSASEAGNVTGLDESSQNLLNDLVDYELTYGGLNETIKEAKANNSGAGDIFENSENLAVKIEASISIEPKRSSTENEFVLEIAPIKTITVYDVEDHNISIVAASEKMEIDSTVTLKIPIPESYAVADSNYPSGYKDIYVKHTTKGKTYVYVAKVIREGEVTPESPYIYYMVFDNPHGFSEFTVSKVDSTVATVVSEDGETSTNYISFQDALDSVKSGETITILKPAYKNTSCRMTAKADTTMSFNVSADSEILWSISPANANTEINISDTSVATIKAVTVSYKEVQYVPIWYVDWNTYSEKTEQSQEQTDIDKEKEDEEKAKLEAEEKAKAEAEKKAKEEQEKAKSNLNVNKLVKSIKFKATTKYTNGNDYTKVNLNVLSGSKNIKKLTDAGYTIKYAYYKSTKKASGYKKLGTLAKKYYTVKKGSVDVKYYYKVKLLVYDGKKLIASTILSQCTPGMRIWDPSEEVLKAA